MLCSQMSVQIFGKTYESDSVMQIKVILQYLQGGYIYPGWTGSFMWNKELVFAKWYNWHNILSDLSFFF